MTETLKDQRYNSPATWKWTRERYDRCVEEGIFTTLDQIELLDGELLTMSPQYTPHSTATSLALHALNEAFGPEFFVRCQMPFALDDASEPEPDLAVVAGGPRDYLAAHPSLAVLLVEVADSTLAYDRGRKLAAYARNGVPEYWIINLLDRQLEVYRQPVAAAAEFAEQQILRSGQFIAPLGRPETSIAIDDLLP